MPQIKLDKNYFKLKYYLLRWENLRKNAMTRQTEIHENLMYMQKNEMKHLRDWMTDMEDRISQMGEILYSRIDEHNKNQTTLEKDISEHQVQFRIIRISNSV